VIKYFFLFLFIVFNLEAKASKVQNEQLYINALEVTNTAWSTEASGKVVAYSPTYYITADRIIHDKNSSLLELFGNVNVVKNCQIYTVSDYVQLKLSDDSMDISPFFMSYNQNQTWLNSKHATLKDDVYLFDSSTLSSCSSDNPEWWFRFSHAKFDKNKEWIDTYHTTIYIQNIPIFYTPYFGFPTDEERRSGLLVPTVGWSRYEGLEYSQPIYYAPRADYDIELVPQIRTKRGSGAYGYFRYADSPNSILHIKGGFFNDYDQFKEKYNMKSNQHYGYTVDYKRHSILSKHSDQNASDGLYINATYLNDVDYMNLEHHKHLNFGDLLQDKFYNEEYEIDEYDPKEFYDKKVESKINYYYKNPKNYYGAYVRYYIDTSKDDNNETMQLLPELHYHQFTAPLLYDNMYYSLDVNLKNHYRPDSINAKELDVLIPLGISFSFFDNWLFLDLKEKLSSTFYNYSNTDQDYKDGVFIQDIKEISISSDLLKPYEQTIHTLGLKAMLSIPKKLTVKGDIYQITNDDAQLSHFGIEQGNKNFTLALNQYFYDKKSLKNLITHTIKQPFIYSNEKWEKSNLENETTLNFDIVENLNSKLTNRFVYNHTDRRVIESSSTVNLTDQTKYAKLSHYLSRESDNTSFLNNDTRTIEIGTRFKRYYTLSSKVNYDFLNKSVSKSYVQLTMNKHCWKYSWKFENDLVAAATVDHQAQRQHIIYFTIELRNIGAFEYKLAQNKL
jgi:LPS-assembly protein